MEGVRPTRSSATAAHLLLFAGLLWVAATPLLGQTNEFGVTYGNLRGTNLYFNSSMQFQTEFALLSHPIRANQRRTGTYANANVDSELAFIAKSGFNNVRVWPPFFGWIIDRAQFRKNLTHFLRRCRHHRLSVSYVLWSSTGNGPRWDTVDIADLIKGRAKDPTDDRLYRDLLALTLMFQIDRAKWVPPGKPWHAAGYPFPGNGLLRKSGNPGDWENVEMRRRVGLYLDDLFSILSTAEGRATMFQIDLGNELDVAGIPSKNAHDFLQWTHERVRRVFPNVNLTVGWARSDVPSVSESVAALRQRGINLARHSFHIYVSKPGDYATRLTPLIRWAKQNDVPLMVTEFYRTDTEEWGQLDTALRFFAENEISTIMWGFIATNLFDDPHKPGNAGTSHQDGVVEVNWPSFDHRHVFVRVNDDDYAAVLRYNRSAFGRPR